MRPIKLGNIGKFSFGEMTSNSNGKTSATSTAGLYIIAIGGICFFLGCIGKLYMKDSLDVISQSIIFTGVGATLLGVKNVYNGKTKTFMEDSDTQPVEEKTETEVKEPDPVQVNS